MILKWIWHSLYTVNERNDAPWILESVSTVVSSKSEYLSRRAVVLQPRGKTADAAGPWPPCSRRWSPQGSPHQQQWFTAVVTVVATHISCHEVHAPLGLAHYCHHLRGLDW